MTVFQLQTLVFLFLLEVLMRKYTKQYSFEREDFIIFLIHFAL